MAKKVDEKFPGAEKHEMFLKEAKQHIQRHKKKPTHPKLHGGSFDRAAIDKILAQPGCTRLRYYYGRNKSGKPNLILVGVNAEGKDMTACIMERPNGCPPFCDKTSELLKV